MNDQANGEWDQLERRVTRRRFVGLTIGGGAAVLSGGPILQAATVANAPMAWAGMPTVRLPAAWPWKPSTASSSTPVRCPLVRSM